MIGHSFLLQGFCQKMVTSTLIDVCTASNSFPYFSPQNGLFRCPYDISQLLEDLRLSSKPIKKRRTVNGPGWDLSDGFNTLHLDGDSRVSASGDLLPVIGCRDTPDPYLHSDASRSNAPSKFDSGTKPLRGVSACISGSEEISSSLCVNLSPRGQGNYYFLPLLWDPGTPLGRG